VRRVGSWGNLLEARPPSRKVRACRRTDLAYSAPQISFRCKRQAMAAKGAKAKIKKVVLAYSVGSTRRSS